MKKVIQIEIEVPEEAQGDLCWVVDGAGVQIAHELLISPASYRFDRMQVQAEIDSNKPGEVGYYAMRLARRLQMKLDMIRSMVVTDITNKETA